MVMIYLILMQYMNHRMQMTHEHSEYDATLKTTE